MKVYIVVDYEDLESIQVFSNKSDAEDYMLNYIFNGSRIKYSIQLTIDQIEKLDKILKGIDEMEDIKSKIKSFSDTIINLIG